MTFQAPLEARLSAGLGQLESAGRLRKTRRIETLPGARIRVNDRDLVNFASNNYLALAQDERVRRAAGKAAEAWGGGATGSRLMGGTLAVHEALESALAEFKGMEACLVFPSGYHANVGMIPALAEPDDAIVLDRLAHASLVDGARLSKARLRVFRHNDPGDLDRVLARLHGSGERWVLTESVFSMDGDRAPLSDLLAVCRRRGARLYVDEAHGTGVWGPLGRGWVNAQGIADQVDVCMGTLSKAFGAQGGFVCGSAALIQWAVNRARAFIYSTALAPAGAGAALAALEIAGSEPERRDRLFSLSSRLWKGLGQQGEGPIVPYIVGDERKAVEVSARLWDEGFFAPAVRFPTVPKGRARLRLSVTAGHTMEDVEALLRSIRP